MIIRDGRKVWISACPVLPALLFALPAIVLRFMTKSNLPIYLREREKENGVPANCRNSPRLPETIFSGKKGKKGLSTGFIISWNISKKRTESIYVLAAADV